MCRNPSRRTGKRAAKLYQTPAFAPKVLDFRVLREGPEATVSVRFDLPANLTSLAKAARPQAGAA